MEGYLTSARKIDYCKNEWADIHLKPAFQRRRVGGNPLSAKNLGKNEWVEAHSKHSFQAKKSGSIPTQG